MFWRLAQGLWEEGEPKTAATAGCLTDARCITAEIIQRRRATQQAEHISCPGLFSFQLIRPNEVSMT